MLSPQAGGQDDWPVSALRPVRSCTYPSGDGTEACDRPLRRSRRLDAARRERRPGGRPLTPDALLRPGHALHHLPRRDRPEVLRRRRDGGVRRAVRARGRPRARGSRSTRRSSRASASSGSRCASGSRSGEILSDETETTFADRSRDQRGRPPAAGGRAGGDHARPERRATDAPASSSRRRSAPRRPAASRTGSRRGASSRSPRTSAAGSSSRCRSSGARRRSSCSTTRSRASSGTTACTS